MHCIVYILTQPTVPSMYFAKSKVKIKHILHMSCFNQVIYNVTIVRLVLYLFEACLCRKQQTEKGPFRCCQAHEVADTRVSVAVLGGTNCGIYTLFNANYIIMTFVFTDSTCLVHGPCLCLRKNHLSSCFLQVLSTSIRLVSYRVCPQVHDNGALALEIELYAYYAIFTLRILINNYWVRRAPPLCQRVILRSYVRSNRELWVICAFLSLACWWRCSVSFFLFVINRRRRRRIFPEVKVG